MALDWNQIVQAVESRRRDDGEVKKRMIEVKDRYNGDWVMPLPSAQGEPNYPLTLPNLVADGIETLSLRAAAVTPMIAAPALDRSKRTGVRSVEVAEMRRRAWKGCWHFSQASILRRRAYRHLNAYGSNALVVVPDFGAKRARVETRDPLTTYADDRDPDDVRAVTDVAFVFGRSARWIIREWGGKLMPSMMAEAQRAARADETWDLVEWVDADQVVMGILGTRAEGRYWRSASHDGRGLNQVLARWPNRMGRAPVVSGRRVTLERVAGQMDAMLPTVDLAEWLMSLEVDATQKTIYPDRYVLSSDNREPELVSGEWKDGRDGGINRISNARQIGYLLTQPNQMATQISDRLESAIRQSAGVNALSSGLQPGSLRTGRALDSFQGFSIEPRLVELNDVDARAWTSVNEMVADMELAYFPGAEIESYAGEATEDEVLFYVPSKTWETNRNAVIYPLPGADINNMTLAAAQISQAGIGSKKDAMALHPAIHDPDRSMREIQVEAMDDAILRGFQQQLAQGGIPMAVAVLVRKKIHAGMTLDAAIEEADEEVKQRQATEVPAGSPEAAPGIVPGAPAGPREAPPVETVQRRPDQAAFREVVNALRATSPAGAPS